MYPGVHAQTTPDKAAYIMASTGEVVTYSALDAGANRLSSSSSRSRVLSRRFRIGMVGRVLKPKRRFTL